MPKLRSGKHIEANCTMPGESPVAPPRSKHASNGSSTYKDNTEVKQLHDCVTQLQASVQSFRTDFQLKIDSLAAECKTKADIGYLKSQLDIETGILIARIETVEQRITKVEAHLAKQEEYDTETTIIARGLPTMATEGSELLNEAKKLVQEILGLNDVTVKRAKRLPSRNGQPGLVKVQFENLDDKKSVLRAKQKTREREGYRNVYLRSSKTHVERLLELNFRALIDEIPDGQNKFKMTSNGRLVRRDENNSEESAQTERNREGARGRGFSHGQGRGRGRGQDRGWERQNPRHSYSNHTTPQQVEDGNNE